MPSNEETFLLDRSQDIFRYLREYYSEVSEKTLEKSRQAAIDTKLGVNHHYLEIFHQEKIKT